MWLAGSSFAGLTPLMVEQGLASQPTLSRFSAIIAAPDNLTALSKSIRELAARGPRALKYRACVYHPLVVGQPTKRSSGHNFRIRESVLRATTRQIGTSGPEGYIPDLRVLESDGVFGLRPFPTTAFSEVLHIELMVEVGLREAALSIRGERHEALCWIGCVCEGDGDLYPG